MHSKPLVTVFDIRRQLSEYGQSHFKKNHHCSASAPGQAKTWQPYLPVRHECVEVNPDHRRKRRSGKAQFVKQLAFPIQVKVLPYALAG
jgi:hypothetical protein